MEEINNINNYLELESLRYGKKVHSTINIEGEIDGINVPPLLYITFIENCFKHNKVSDENFKLVISFKNIDSKQLMFNAQNTLTSPIENKKGKKTGIGIENIKRRLNLIYKENFSLEINTKNNIFTVELKIPI